MRRILLCLAILAGAEPLRAGVYNLDPPRKYPSDYAQTLSPDPPLQKFLELGELRAAHDLAVDPKNPPAADSLRVSYEKQFTELEAKRKESTLTPFDRVNLGACLMRLGRYARAREMLDESLRVIPPNSPARCLLQLNLASAYQEEGTLLQRAIDLQQQALRSWPDSIPGWKHEESNWYRRVEHYALTLMRLRQREQLRSQGRPASELPPLDELFGTIRFIGASGEYEAGTLAFEQANRLPADAERIVFQLLLWRPLDDRLHWLYAELLNARGQVDWAFSILDSFKKSEKTNREMRRHHQVLREVVEAAPYDKLFRDKTGSGENLRLQASILWALAPRGGLATPGMGAAANEAGGIAVSGYRGKQTEVFPVASSSPEQLATTKATANGVLPDWRLITVSFVTGVIVAVLAALQWQQWRRRLSSTRKAEDGMQKKKSVGL